MASGIVAGQRGDAGAAVYDPIKNCGLSFYRHSSSQYRKRVVATTSRIGWSEITQETGCLNQLHFWLCRSAYWRRTLEQRVPWVLSSADLGRKVLEAGPGPGLTTDLLRSRVARLTAIETDSAQANSLRSRLNGTNVEVVAGDATSMPFPDATFSGCAAFTMLHHVPSHGLQDKLLREVCRVLEPGGAFVGSDSLQSAFMRVLHIADTFVPVDPDTFDVRLEAAGFEVIELEKASGAFRFYARKPGARGR
jgi:SAM-dependent methyltransferase